MNFKRKGAVLFEIILSIALFSIVLTYTTNITLDIYKSYKSKSNTLNSLLILESTRHFIKKHSKNIDDLRYEDKKIFFKNNLLLNLVERFNILKENNIITIDINYNGVIQTWKIKDEQ